MSNDDFLKDPEEGGRLMTEISVKSDRFVGIADDYHVQASSEIGSHYLDKEQLIESNSEKDKEIENLHKQIDKHKDKLLKQQRQLIEISKTQNEHVKLILKLKEIIDECK